VIAALSAFVVAGAVSAAAYPLRHLGPDTPEEFYAATQASLDRSDGPVDLVDADVPGFVLGPPESTFRRALAQFGDRVRFPTVVQDDYFVVDARGRLVRPDLDPARNARAPAPAACGYPVRSERTVPLDGPVLGFGWRLRIAYTADADTDATITIGDVATDAHLLAGRHVLELPGDAAYDAVRVSGVDPTSRLCLASLTVGTTKIPQ
jgi:hypothetical protein